MYKFVNSARSKRVLGKYTVYTFVLFLIALSLFSGCEKKVDGPVIARVGNSVLTLEDLYNSIPPEYSQQITREQNVTYVKQWVDTELLYREALRRKIDKEQLIRQRLEKMKKDLLSSEMISRSSLSGGAEVLNERTISEYYHRNRSEFIRATDRVKYLEIVVENSATAQEIRRTLHESNYSELAARHSKIPVVDIGQSPYVSLEEIPPSIRKAILSVAIPGTAEPVKTEAGFHIIRVLDKLDKGGFCTEDEVREDIINRLANQTHKEEVDRLISDLRLKNDVEFHFDLIPGADVNVSKTAETQ